jgi:hypothetical protein
MSIAQALAPNPSRFAAFQAESWLSRPQDASVTFEGTGYGDTLLNPLTAHPFRADAISIKGVERHRNSELILYLQNHFVFDNSHLKFSSR